MEDILIFGTAFSEEQQVQEMEKEMRMQQSANEVCHGSTVHSAVILDKLTITL